MSDLSNSREAREWVKDWATNAGPTRALRVIEAAAAEQRANLGYCVGTGKYPAKFLRDYEKSVEILERAIKPARARVRAWEKTIERNALAARRNLDEYLERVRNSYPVHG